MAALFWHSLPTSTTRPAVRPRLLIEVRGFVAGLSGVAMLSLILTQADKLLLSRLLTLEQFGYYTLASVLANGLAMINAPVFNALFPRFTALVAAGNAEAIAPLFRRSSQWVAVGTVPAALMIALFSIELVALWTGSAQTGLATGSLLTALILGTALNGLMNLPYALQLAYGNTSLALSFNMILVATYLPLLVVATTWFGAFGAAWAWTAVNVVYVIVGVPLTSRRVLGSSARGWFSDLGLVVLTSFTVVAAWWLTLSGRTLSRGAWFGILAAVLVTATAAAAAVLPQVRQSAVRGMAGRLRRSA
jgi:O-antigen/teichoic acid export membrane protein